MTFCESLKMWWAVDDGYVVCNLVVEMFLLVLLPLLGLGWMLRQDEKDIQKQINRIKEAEKQMDEIVERGKREFRGRLDELEKDIRSRRQ